MSETLTEPYAFNLPFDVIVDPLTGVSADWDISDNEPTGLVCYVDATNGNDANDGSTMELAKKSLYNALAISQRVEYRLAAGNYFPPYGWNSLQMNRSCSVKCVDAAPAYLYGPNATTNGRIGNLSSNITVYLENLIFSTGGTQLYALGNGSSATFTIYAKNCKFINGWGNGVSIVGGTAYFEDCEAGGNLEDGFNYQAYAGVAPFGVEINCIGGNNGESGNNDNGSSMHGAGKMVRIGGRYFANAGPNCADIDASKTWCVGTSAYGSIATASVSKTDFLCTGSGGEMWLDLCKAAISDNSLSIGAGSTVYHTRSMLPNTIVNDGTITRIACTEGCAFR